MKQIRITFTLMSRKLLFLNSKLLIINQVTAETFAEFQVIEHLLLFT